MIPFASKDKKSNRKIFTKQKVKGMTRSGRRLVGDFLVPALNDRRYGDLLKWVDRDKKYFTIRWSHKNASKWSLEDTIVFQDWDKLKGHFRPELKGYYMQAKQRFRAALYKLSTVIKVDTDDKQNKMYQIVSENVHRRAESMAKVKNRSKNNRKSIPCSVICENTSYARKQEVAYSETVCTPPYSPASTSKNDEAEALERARQEYTIAQMNQMRSNHNPDQYQSDDNKEEDQMEVNGADDHPGQARNQRVPYLPVQPAPIYNNGLLAIYDAAQKRFESPKILLVQTYNDTIMKEEPPSNVGCVFHEPDALNLCVKSDGVSLSR